MKKRLFLIVAVMVLAAHVSFGAGEEVFAVVLLGDGEDGLAGIQID